MRTIKNIVAMKYRKHKVELPPNAVLSLNDFKFNEGFMLESGSDTVDGVEREYIIVKMYIKEET